MRYLTIRVSILALVSLALMAPSVRPDTERHDNVIRSPASSRSHELDLSSTHLLSSSDLFPSQTCWGQKFDIVVTGLTGDLKSDCHEHPEILLRFIIWEEDGGWLDPNDNVREEWVKFETSGLTYGIPYGNTLEDVHLAGWCDEWDWEGEFFVEVYGPCLASTYTTSKEEVDLIFYPSSATLVAPANGANVPGQPITLQWNGLRNATSYQVQLDDDDAFSSPIVDEHTGSISFDVSGLVIDSAYFWRVRAHNSTCGDGNWSVPRYFTVDTPTDVEEIESPLLPAEFVLGQNHPNPFNPVTDIEFTLPHACHVTLGIYNVSGQRIRTLVDENLTSGYKIVSWDGTNDGGKAVASGIYLYRLVAGENEASRRMVLLK